MSDFIETIKTIQKHKDRELIVEKSSNHSYRTQSEIGPEALIQRRIYKQAIEIMEETIEDMDKEIELKTTKFNFYI